MVNDRVLVEAVCLPNMPFKWNATRIQVLPMNDTPRGTKKGFVVSSSPLDRGTVLIFFSYIAREIISISLAKR